MELRAERGRAVLVGAPERFRPPAALAGALDEWAEVAHVVCANGRADPATAELVSARGRELAARLAAVAGTAVGYSDPVRGVLERVPAAVSDSSAADAAPSPNAHSVPDDTAPHAVAAATWAWPSAATQGPPAQRETDEPRPAEPRQADLPPAEFAPPADVAPPAVDDEPTPWATGLTVSAVAAVVVVVAVVALVRGLAEVAWWLGAAALLAVTTGLAPSVWLSRHTPLWRWVSYGVAGGLALSWVSAALSALGP